MREADFYLGKEKKIERDYFGRWIWHTSLPTNFNCIKTIITGV